MNRTWQRFAAVVTASALVGAAVLAAGASPALAGVSTGTPSGASYTLQFWPDGGGGTVYNCTVSYDLGPNITDVVSDASASCQDPGYVTPPSITATTGANGPNGATCSNSISSFNSADASCTMSSYTGWYSANDTVDINMGPMILMNSVPGCSQPSFEGTVYCSWSGSYQNTDDLGLQP